MFGWMCLCFVDVLKKNYYMKEEDLEFFWFFGSGDLDDGVIKVIEVYNVEVDKGMFKKVYYSDIKCVVCLL